MISPVALLGAIFFQYVSGLSLDIYAQVGLVMLIGLSTKQAILIVEFAKDAMEGVNGHPGLNYIDAAMQAAKLRFRAVMMTNIAFILGLLPLVFAHGAGCRKQTFYRCICVWGDARCCIPRKYSCSGIFRNDKCC